MPGSAKGDRDMAYIESFLPDSVPEGTQLIMGSFAGDDEYYECDLARDVVYAEKDGLELHLQIMYPTAPGSHPLIVYLQGSAWRPQPISHAFGKMFHMASRGYVTALVEYRSTDVARFPAPIEDTKTAIRYLRANAATYHIDPERVAVWGDSSGGYTALMTGFTPGRFSDGSYAEQSDEVDAIVDFYGITDIAHLGYLNDSIDHDAPTASESLFIGGPKSKRRAKADAASPLYNIPEGDVAPTLIVHGDADRMVSVTQSMALYAKMRELHKPVQFYKVIGADHGPGVWQKAVFDIVDAFLRNCFARKRAQGRGQEQVQA